MKSHVSKFINIEIASTCLADLAMQGFGSIYNCSCFKAALEAQWPNVQLAVIKSPADLEQIKQRDPMLVVNGIKYVDFSSDRPEKTSTEKIWLASFLKSAGIEFAGSEAAAVRLEFDKPGAEAQADAMGIPTAGAFVVNTGRIRAGQQMTCQFPLFVKPCFESDSRGVDERSIVYDTDELLAKALQIERDFHQPAMAEAYLPGKEFTVAILEKPTGGLLTAPVELRLNDSGDLPEFIGFAAKHENIERLRLISDPTLLKSVSGVAGRAFKALGARDFGRIDIKLDSAGEPRFLEANLLPGMNPENSYFPAAFNICHGMDYISLTKRMIEPALCRLDP